MLTTSQRDPNAGQLPHTRRRAFAVWGPNVGSA